MNVGSVCVSHSPLRDRNRPDPDKEARFDAAIAEAGRFVADRKPDLAVVFYPDHVNGFFYNLMPSFCIGVEGRSVGDYGTAAGELDIPSQQAMDLARFVLDAGVDVAISYDMKVDHGAVQPLEWFMEGHSHLPVIPIFINCACDPRPSFDRVRALGKAVGHWARENSLRVLMVGSGGLSHDPPMPTIEGADSTMRQRLIGGSELNHKFRLARQSGAHREGRAMADGRSSLLPPNAKWDKDLMAAFLAGDLTVLDGVADEDITLIGGRGGHEVRAWVAALATLEPGYEATELFYDVIDEWITGMGMLHAVDA